MVNGRNKGASAEREFAKILGDRLGCQFVRNLEQSRGGGYDLLSDLPFAIEVKRVEVLQLEKWWEQAVRQAGEKVPVLAYRQNRQPWRVVVPLGWVSGDRLSVELTATLSVEGFCALVTQRYALA